MSRPYDRFMNDFRSTDIRYQGSGGYRLAQQELAQEKFRDEVKSEVQKLQNEKSKLYLSYLNNAYFDRRKKAHEAYIRRQEAIYESNRRFPGEYQEYKNKVQNIQRGYYDRGVYTGRVPKAWFREKPKEVPLTELEKPKEVLYELAHEQIPLAPPPPTVEVPFTINDLYLDENGFYKSRGIFYYNNVGHNIPKVQSNGLYKIKTTSGNNYVVLSNGQKSSRDITDILITMNYHFTRRPTQTTNKPPPKY